MRVNDRERMVLIRDVCKRLGEWSAMNSPFSSSTIEAIRADADRLVELIDARDLSLLRKRYGSPERMLSEEG